MYAIYEHESGPDGHRIDSAMCRFMLYLTPRGISYRNLNGACHSFCGDLSEQ